MIFISTSLLSTGNLALISERILVREAFASINSIRCLLFPMAFSVDIGGVKQIPLAPNKLRLKLKASGKG
jgi:hypothetical protein